VWSLAYFAGHGFAHGGRFPLAAAVGLGVGTGLVMFPGRRGAPRAVAGAGRSAMEEAA
jgi:hypothetical protein